MSWRAACHNCRAEVGGRLAGSVIVELASEAYFAPNASMSANLAAATELASNFSRATTGTSLPGFTRDRLNYGLGKYPDLHGKAYACRVVLAWLAETTKKQVRRQLRILLAAPPALCFCPSICASVPLSLLVLQFLHVFFNSRQQRHLRSMPICVRQLSTAWRRCASLSMTAQNTSPKRRLLHVFLRMLDFAYARSFVLSAATGG